MPANATVHPSRIRPTPLAQPPVQPAPQPPAQPTAHNSMSNPPHPLLYLHLHSIPTSTPPQRRNWKTRWVVVDDKQFVSWYKCDEKDPQDRTRRELKGSLGLHGAQMIAGKRQCAARNSNLQRAYADHEGGWGGILRNRHMVPEQDTQTSNHTGTYTAGTVLLEAQTRSIPLM